MKKWKISLSIILVILVGTAGTLYYFLKVKDYHTADKAVEKITESNYTIKLPDPLDKLLDTGDVANDSEKNVGTDSNSPKNGESTSASSKAVNTSKGTLSTNRTTKLTVNEIKARFKPVFADLQNQANAKIDGLVNYAFSEYKTKKANGESISYSYFYSKYTSASGTLEANTDATFNMIYNALTNELKKSGYSPNEAKEFRDQYESTKKQRRQALMKKAFSQL
jgi:hypothetical protein